MPDSRGFRNLTQIACMVHNKECSDSSAVDESFNMSFLIRKEGRRRGWLSDTEFVIGRHFRCQVPSTGRCCGLLPELPLVRPWLSTCPLED
jgi:hypothetical protein